MVVAAILWSSLAASVLLAVVAAGRRSWRLMLPAALLSLLFSLAAILSVGPYSLLLTALEIASAVGMRRDLTARGWAFVIVVALSVWTLTVPLQVFLFDWPPLELLLPVALLAAVAALLADPRRTRPNPGGSPLVPSSRIDPRGTRVAISAVRASPWPRPAFE